MPPLESSVIALAGIALFAAFVNGALGYGFSSLSVPVALVFYSNRVLNPAIVVIEVFINLYVLFINLDGVQAVWRRVLPILIGLLPGIAVGALVLASLQPSWIKFGTYTVILPLILLQAAGWRRPIRSTWLVGLPFGTTLGILYSVTTISGPPLAILFNNQGSPLTKNSGLTIAERTRAQPPCGTGRVQGDVRYRPEPRQGIGGKSPSEVRPPLSRASTRNRQDVGR